MQIHIDAARGDKDAVLRELESGVPVDTFDDEGRTPLMAAVSSAEPNLEVVQLLLDKGANPNIPGGGDTTPILLDAIGSGSLALLQCLLDGGADVNLTKDGYVDALTCAVRRVAQSNDQHTLSMIELLLESGASVEVDEDGESALSIAFQNGQFDIVKRLLEAGADETRLGLTALMRAIVLGTVDDVREQLEQGASLTEREEVGERTPWLLALSAGIIEKAQLLLEAGSQRDDIGWYQKTALMYPIEANDPEMLKWLISIGCDIESAGEYGGTPLMKASERDAALLVKILLEAGADPNKVDHSYRNAIEFTSSMEVVRLLLAAGQDINKASRYLRTFLFGVGDNDTFVVSRGDTEAGAQPRFGTSNPEKMNVPFWQAMARTGESSEARRILFASYDENLLWENSLDDYPHEKFPLWFYPRTGMSLTALPDGRFVEIGGYFEEGGNPNFCIYNEVFVRCPNQALDIWGYPADVFPPTDGHSATLVGDSIYIIGCIGYPEERVVGYTPVYRLNVDTFTIEKIETSGENPGWIFRHKANLRDGEIHISGGDVWNGPDTPEQIEQKSAERAKRVDFPVREDFASDSEWIEATGRHLDANRIEEPQRAESFALDLNSLQWRRVTD